MRAETACVQVGLAASKLSSSFFSGEGLVTRFTGERRRVHGLVHATVLWVLSGLILYYRNVGLTTFTTMWLHTH